MVRPRSRLRWRGWTVLLTLGLGLSSNGCSPDAPPRADTQTLAPPASTTVPLPDSAESFLRQLAPLPFEAVRVHYDVTGPAGMTGDLTVIARPGGLRREDWRLEVPVPEHDPIVIGGSMIATASAQWTDAVQGAPVVHSVPLRALAEAYLELQPELRALVMFRIGQWHDALEKGRSEHPGTRERVLGQPCLQTSVASHRVCVWEQTGLPLTYEGEAFQVRARAIDIDPTIDPSRFTIPPGAKDPPEAGRPLDAEAGIARLAGGDFAELAVWLQPGLRLDLQG